MGRDRSTEERPRQRVGRTSGTDCTRTWLRDQHSEYVQFSGPAILRKPRVPDLRRSTGPSARPQPLLVVETPCSYAGLREDSVMTKRIAHAGWTMSALVITFVAVTVTGHPRAAGPGPPQPTSTSSEARVLSVKSKSDLRSMGDRRPPSVSHSGNRKRERPARLTRGRHRTSRR